MRGLAVVAFALGLPSVLAAFFIARSGHAPACAAYRESASTGAAYCVEWAPNARKPPPKRGLERTIVR